MTLTCQHDPLPWVQRSTDRRTAKRESDSHDLAPRAEYCQQRAHYLPEWISVKLAARIVRKAPRTIYAWIQRDRLATRLNGDGVTEVLSKAVLRIEPTVRRGRPRGTPTRR